MLCIKPGLDAGGGGGGYFLIVFLPYRSFNYSGVPGDSEVPGDWGLFMGTLGSPMDSAGEILDILPYN